MGSLIFVKNEDFRNFRSLFSLLTAEIAAWSVHRDGPDRSIEVNTVQCRKKRFVSADGDVVFARSKRCGGGYSGQPSTATDDDDATVTAPVWGVRNGCGGGWDDLWCLW